jgi:hypothetical protein
MTDRPHRTEQTLRRVLRDLPPRRAPATLESRVLRSLRNADRERCAGQGFGYWPLLGRLTCIAVCGALAILTLMGEAWLESPTTLIPAGWWYAGLAAASYLYAAFFGLAALGYHTLYLSPSRTGSPS